MSLSTKNRKSLNGALENVIKTFFIAFYILIILTVMLSQMGHLKPSANYLQLILVAPIISIIATTLSLFVLRNMYLAVNFVDLVILAILHAYFTGICIVKSLNYLQVAYASDQIEYFMLGTVCICINFFLADSICYLFEVWSARNKKGFDGSHKQQSI